MSKFQVGDKVKFLNQVGGGVVTRVTDDFIFVQDDTGFDMPLPPSELIRMADMSGAAKVFNSKIDVQVNDGVTEFIHKRYENEPQQAPVKQKPLSLEEENRQLKSQVANLKDQVAKLKKQLEQMQRANSQKLNDNILLQHLTAPGEAEVDLHIDRLHERPDTLSPHEVFELQMRYFRTCLNHAEMNGIKRIVFIHGVGKGVLKDEIMKELKLYDNIHFFDAPMSKYGVGATEVYFK
ncbi:MAG: Smr/MutS family protein [Bacteroidales bacterium]|nr:Smr/MutS family protein [Bacteroidales bacterium]